MTAGGILTAAGRVIPGDACKHHEKTRAMRAGKPRLHLTMLTHMPQ